ncbi:hypothetical protein [Sphingobium sp. YC-XJ3]|uniref:hypothetical protein n=1 Tax=Sphingobium sp. YC-XJ3 TaxID=3024245 RepID=UPI00235FBE37|nr:hypothetical protein [Sphingobium sp. YC-XJ3]WDA37024.1 hypothetical protein PO876_02100 [Sphingobium sp. YC-XJ3]
MQLGDRNIVILGLLKQRTERNTVSRKAAREALISEGIYTRKGKLRKEYGGKGKKAKSVA